MTADTAELLPCPFCGGMDVSLSVGKNGDGSPYHYVECGACGATAEPANWNCRAFPQARAALPARAPEGSGIQAERQAWIDAADALIESLQEGIMTDAGIKQSDREKMRAQIDALDALKQERAAMLSASPPLPEQKEERDDAKVYADFVREVNAAPMRYDFQTPKIGSEGQPYREPTEPLASPAPGPAEPVVRALEWLSPVKPFYAVTPFCQYCIDSVNDDTGPHWQTTISYQGSMYRRHDTEEEAKAAAQADYESRILSALTQPAPAQVAGGEANRRPDVGEPGWREAEAGRQGAEARADALAARVAELEARDKVLTGIMANVPDALHLTSMGTVVQKLPDGTYAPDDGWANRTAHGLAGVLCRARANLAALQPKAPAPAGEGGGS